MSTIGSIMKTEIATARSEETVAEVARRMSQKRIGAVLLVDGGKLTGLFSERDLLTRVVAAGKDPAQTPVGEVATREVVSVTPNTHIKSCAETIKSGGFRHLPVAEGDAVVGIISARDFFAYLSKGLERFIDQARYEQRLDEGVDPYDHLGGGYEEP